MSLSNKLFSYLNRQPFAYAKILGSRSYARISGWVYFYQVNGGVLLVIEVTGLPSGTQLCTPPFLGFHIHEGTSCSGTDAKPFANAGGHYNPNQCAHPEHAGDLPPLLSNEGYAFMAVVTGRFTVQEIIGRTIIIHASPDDFTTQPSGNSGEMIACGHIERTGFMR